ncbi:MAG: radical SAM protein [Nanobdellota archaeon]
MKKVAIVVGYTCNNNCLFCYDKEKRDIPCLTTNQIFKILEYAKKEGCEYLDFLGGEFTIRKDALELVKYAKKLGFRIISLTTNGRALAYRKYLGKLIDAGINSIVFSIHGHNETLHDKQTQVPGSFQQLIKGISNAKSYGLEIKTNTTITKYNYEYLPKIAEFLISLGCTNAEFPYFDPKNKNTQDIKRIMPKISDSAPYIKNCLKIGKEKSIKHWHIRYFPLCYLEGFHENLSEATSPFEQEMHFGPEFSNTDVDNSRKKIGRIKNEECEGCKYNRICEGIFPQYKEVFGISELWRV